MQTGSAIEQLVVATSKRFTAGPGGAPTQMPPEVHASLATHAPQLPPQVSGPHCLPAHAGTQPIPPVPLAVELTAEVTVVAPPTPATVVTLEVEVAPPVPDGAPPFPVVAPVVTFPEAATLVVPRLPPALVALGPLAPPAPPALVSPPEEQAMNKAGSVDERMET